MAPNQPQIGQSWYQSIPLYMYVHSEYKVGTLLLTEVNLRWTGMEISSFITYRMLNHLTFFKPMGPNQPEIGQ